MIRLPLFTTGLTALFLLAASALPVSAQACPSGMDTFWKNDNLPDIPGGPLTVSVIQGLCEGEAAGSIFVVPAGSPAQQLKQVSVGFGHTTGGSGWTATANVEIYEGAVSFAGANATLGTKIFDLNADYGASVQISTTGLNVVDLTNYNIVVSDDFVVAFRMNINFNGSCSAGYSANFFTDYAGGGGCQTTVGVNLMDELTQGWIDPALATISGFPLCPLFFNGNWAIRACTSGTGTPASAAFRNGGANPASYTATNLPVLGATYIATVDCGGTTGHSFAMLAGYGAPFSFTLGAGQTALVDPSGPEYLRFPMAMGPVATIYVPIPPDIAYLGMNVYTQAAHFGGPVPFALSNAQDLVLGY
jgi:hypothetical protein